MKRISVLVLLLALALSLAACSCEHEWSDATCTLPRICKHCKQIDGNALGHLWAKATCTAPKTCKDCGATDGEAAGHNWKDADCTAPKTCSVCGTTEGTVTDHSWQDATCTDPKTCGICGMTEGEALGHVWQDATTETPKTCTVCAVTEGERIITDPRFTTASTLILQGAWTTEKTVPCAELDMENWEALEIDWFSGELQCSYTFTFHPDGTATAVTRPIDPEAYKDRKCAYNAETVYEEYERQGLTGWNADQNYMVSFGMKLYDYMKYQLDHTDLDAYFESIADQYVYYVADGTLYISESWDGDFRTCHFAINDSSLTLTGAENVTLTKTEE